MGKETISNKSSSVFFKNVSKIFGKNSLAVEDLSITIEAGKLVTLLGPSGCGKTTVLRMIAGLEMPTSGQIFLGDKDITKLPATDRDISMVFQSYALFPHMNILKNISFGLKFSGFPKNEIREIAEEGLKLVGLDGMGERLPNELSGGQQQRAAVARAIVLKPEVILFDEPLSNLDVKLRRSVREEIRELQQNLGLTVAYVTHDQEEALAISDYIVVMKKARLAQQGTPQEIFNHPKDTFVADFLGEANLIQCKLLEIEGDKAHVVLDQLELCVSAGAYQSGKHRIAIRPNDIILKTEKEENMPEATIKKASYLGMEMEYTIETRFGDLFVTSSNVVQPYEVGESVYISFVNNKIVLVELEKE